MKKKVLGAWLVLTLCLNLFAVGALAKEQATHADADHDHLCDDCGQPCYSLSNTDGSRICAAEGCGALETEINADYTNLYYFENYEKPGEISAGGAIEITVTAHSSPEAAVTAGKVVAWWTDHNGDTVPFSSVEMPLNGNSVKIYFGGIPVEFLDNGHLFYYPPESSADYLPSCGEFDATSQSNVHDLRVSGNVNFTVNYTPAKQLPVFSGTFISIDLPADAEGSYEVSFDAANSGLAYTKEGNSVTFTMPDNGVTATVTWISCTTHTDSSRDHLCDICGKVSSVCEDKNNNHKCDVCNGVLTVCSEGETADHKCDLCKKALSSLCSDGNDDHTCDVSACGAKIAGACADTDRDHYCDSAACSRQLTTCESSDSNRDDICDVCGAALYWLEVEGIKVTEANKSNILGDETASVAYDPTTKTLTLNNANVHATGNYGIRSKLSKSALLTIELIGQNRVAADGVYGLRSTASVVICGSGTLEISAGDIAIYTDGAGSEYGSLTVCENAEVTAAGGKVKTGNGFGVKADDCITVCDNAKLIASSVSAPDRSCGAYAIDSIIVKDSAELVAMGGDLTGRAGTDSYGIRTTHIYVHGGSLTATAGDAADSIGLYTQTFYMTGGKVYAAGATAVLGPSYGLRSNKYLNMSGGSVVALGGAAPNNQSCGLMVNNTSSDSFPDDGGTLTVTGGTIRAIGDTGAFSHGIRANHISVTGGTVIAEASEAADNRDGMTISSGITAESTFTVTGGQITAESASAATFSYGIQAFGMTVNGGSVAAKSGSAATSYGLWSFDKLTVSDASSVVRASSENGYAVYSVKGIDVQAPLRIRKPAGGFVANVADGPETYYVISSYNGTAAKEVLISDPSALSSDNTPSSRYPVVEKNPDEADGTVRFSKSYAKVGETVTVTVTPDKYYRVDKVLILNQKGEDIAATRNEDGSYSFVMPAGKVRVEVIYVWENPFTDIAEDAFCVDAVEWALKNGITKGTDETSFSPSAPCSRAQMMTFLWRAAGSPEPESTACRFTDVDVDSYYGKAVLWALEMGIVNGTSDTTFSPDRTCSRAQMAAFLCRLAGGKAAGDANPFADVDPDAYYAEAVRWAVENGITEGVGGGMYRPDAVCTRAQIVTFLYRYYN